MAYIASDYVGGIGVHDPNILAPLFAGGGTATPLKPTIPEIKGLQVQATQLSNLITNAQLEKDILESRYNNGEVELFSEILTKSQEMGSLLAMKSEVEKNLERYDKEISNTNVDNSWTPIDSNMNTFNVVDHFKGRGKYAFTRTYSELYDAKAKMPLLSSRGTVLPYEIEAVNNLENSFGLYNFFERYKNHIASTYSRVETTVPTDDSGRVTTPSNATSSRTTVEFNDSNFQQLSQFYANILDYYDGLTGEEKESINAIALNNLRTSVGRVGSGDDAYNVYNIFLSPQGQITKNYARYNMIHIDKDNDDNIIRKKAVKEITTDDRGNSIAKFYYLKDDRSKGEIIETDEDKSKLYMVARPLIADDPDNQHNDYMMALLTKYLGHDIEWYKAVAKAEYNTVNSQGDDRVKAERELKSLYVRPLVKAGILKLNTKDNEDPYDKLNIEELKDDFQAAGERFKNTAIRRLIESSTVGYLNVWRKDGYETVRDIKFTSNSSSSSLDDIISGWSFDSWKTSKLVVGDENSIYDSVIKERSLTPDAANALHGGTNSKWHNSKGTLEENQEYGIKEIPKSKFEYTIDGGKYIASIDASTSKALQEVSEGLNVFIKLETADGTTIAVPIPHGHPVRIVKMLNNLAIAPRMVEGSTAFNVAGVKNFVESNGEALVGNALYTVSHGFDMADDFMDLMIPINKDNINSVSGGKVVYKAGRTHVSFDKADLRNKDNFKSAVEKAILGYTNILENKSFIEKFANKHNVTIETFLNNLDSYVVSTIPSMSHTEKRKLNEIRRNANGYLELFDLWDGISSSKTDLQTLFYYGDIEDIKYFQNVIQSAAKKGIEYKNTSINEAVKAAVGITNVALEELYNQRDESMINQLKEQFGEEIEDDRGVMYISLRALFNGDMDELEKAYPSLQRTDALGDKMQKDTWKTKKSNYVFAVYTEITPDRLSKEQQENLSVYIEDLYKGANSPSNTSDRNTVTPF